MSCWLLWIRIYAVISIWAGEVVYTCNSYEMIEIIKNSLPIVHKRLYYGSHALLISHLCSRTCTTVLTFRLYFKAIYLQNVSDMGIVYTSWSVFLRSTSDMKSQIFFWIANAMPEYFFKICRQISETQKWLGLISPACNYKPESIRNEILRGVSQRLPDHDNDPVPRCLSTVAYQGMCPG